MANAKALAGKSAKSNKFGKRAKKEEHYEVKAPAISTGDKVDIDIRLLPKDVAAKIPAVMGVVRINRTLANSYGLTKYL